MPRKKRKTKRASRSGTPQVSAREVIFPENSGLDSSTMSLLLVVVAGPPHVVGEMQYVISSGASRVTDDTAIFPQTGRTAPLTVHVSEGLPAKATCNKRAQADRERTEHRLEKIPPRTPTFLPPSVLAG